VLLDGTTSSDPTAAIQSYAWTQLTGPVITLQNSNSATTSFTAPQVTTATALSFSLTITDSAGATSTAITTIMVSPASAEGLAVRILDARMLVPVPPNPHTDLTFADGPPLAGATSTVEVTLTGAVQAPTFTIVDASGNHLSTPTFVPVGSPSLQPLTFIGSVSIPTVPFRIGASGTTADGQSFTVQLATLFTPMNMSIGFSPSFVLLTPGATTFCQLNVYNSGSAATFTIQYDDQSHILGAGAPTSIQVPAGGSATIAIAVTYPSTTGAIGPTLRATASVAGDPTRSGTATLTLWQGAGP
jgi:hypothetical protein